MVSRVWGTVVVVLVLASVCHAQVRTTMALCFPVLQMSLSTRAWGILSQVLQPPRFADAENQPPAVPGCPTAAVQEAPKACTPAGTVFVMLQYLDLSDLMLVEVQALAWRSTRSWRVLILCPARVAWA